VPHLETSPDKARERLSKALTTARDSLEEARRSVLDLRATALDGEPLSQALRSLGRSFASETGLRVTLQIGDAPALGARVETEIFRIAQEALTNVRKHASAKHVRLSYAEVDGAVVLEIEDDGIGIDGSTVRDGASGLVGMRERARLINGSIEIAPSTSGTRVALTLPEVTP
jgi:signal transduction histidine kinase